MTERALFYSYRNSEGYVTECACGGEIHLQFGTDSAIAEAISIHQLSAVHKQWREGQEAVRALKRPTRRWCSCHSAAWPEIAR